MTRREQLKEYVELCIRNEKAIAPYTELLGTELSIYQVITDNQRYIAKLLHIDEKILEIIEDFAFFGYIHYTDDYNITRKTEDIDRFIDLLLEWEEFGEIAN